VLKFLWYLHTTEFLKYLFIVEAAPLIKEMLIAVDKELYARAEVRTVEGVRLVEGRNQRSWKYDEDEVLKKFSGVKKLPLNGQYLQWLPALKSFAPFGILLSASTTLQSKL
jgi:hypothetical protein